jgi:hypothetical protein
VNESSKAMSNEQAKELGSVEGEEIAWLSSLREQVLVLIKENKNKEESNK